MLPLYSEGPRVLSQLRFSASSGTFLATAAAASGGGVTLKLSNVAWNSTQAAACAALENSAEMCVEIPAKIKELPTMAGRPC